MAFSDHRAVARVPAVGFGVGAVDPHALDLRFGAAYDAWLKLAASPPADGLSRLHFKRVAARATRQVLVEAAPRRRHAEKRGGADAVFVTLDDGYLDLLCLTAMRRNVRRRYQSVEALVRDLDRFREGRPLEARADTRRYRFRSSRKAALADAARTPRIHRFMLALFTGGDDAGPADSLRVATLVARGVQDVRARAAEPGVQAELYATLGVVTEQRGQLPRANSLLTTALERRRALFGSERALARQARWREADRESLAGYQLLVTRTDPAVSYLQAARRDLAAAYDTLGQHDKAARFRAEAA